MKDNEAELRETNQYLYRELQRSEGLREQMEAMWHKELDDIKQQSKDQCLALEKQLKKLYEKELQRFQEQVEVKTMTHSHQHKIFLDNINTLNNDSAHRSKSLSTVQKQHTNKPSYNLPVSHNDSFEAQCGRIKQNSYSQYHHSTNPNKATASLNNSHKKPDFHPEKENQFTAVQEKLCKSTSFSFLDPKDCSKTNLYLDRQSLALSDNKLMKIIN